jgi:hypothetical protein
VRRAVFVFVFVFVFAAAFPSPIIESKEDKQSTNQIKQTNQMQLLGFLVHDSTQHKNARRKKRSRKYNIQNTKYTVLVTLVKPPTSC